MQREQFIKLVESTGKDFRRFLVALCCGDTVLADDLAQESYMKAYLSSDGLNNISKFKSWLFRIGYNAFLNNKRSERLKSDYEEARRLTSPDNADQSFEYEDLYKALDSLAVEERTILLLYYMQDYALKEIAEIVSKSDVAVRQQLSRARKHLRTLLQR